MAAAQAQKIKETQNKINSEKAALSQKAEKTAKNINAKKTAKNDVSKKSEIKIVKIPLKKNSKQSVAKTAEKKQVKASELSSKIYQGQEEIVYCLQYLGLQGEQKNMTVAAEYYAAENGVNKTRYDVAAAEAKKYYENSSEADIKSRADLCGKYITPKNAVEQNKIIRSINRSIGF